MLEKKKFLKRTERDKVMTAGSATSVVKGIWGREIEGIDWMTYRKDSEIVDRGGDFIVTA